MKKGNYCILTGLLLIAAALLLTGYNIWDNYRAGDASRYALHQLLPKIKDSSVPMLAAADAENIGRGMLPGEIEYPDYVLNPEMSMPIENIDGINYIGVISIPAINIELPVAEEWSYSNLLAAPCRYTGTAYLNNMVICAHNYDFHFGQIKNLSYGDEVIFADMDGNVFIYRVFEIVTLQPTATEEMTDGSGDLTLFTCTIGGATRVTVRCERVK